MKKVLIVAYYFPPAGGPGVQRTLKFVKYLPEFGWEPVVLTVLDADFPAKDEALLKEIPPQVKVYRTKIMEPYRLYRKLTGMKPTSPIDVNVIREQGTKQGMMENFTEFVRATFFIPDARIGWLPYGKNMGKEIIQKEDIDVLYSSSPPYTCAIIGQRLHKWSGKPWIAGFRDPWSGFLTGPSRWLLPRKIDQHLERTCYEECTLLEAAWSGIITDFQKKYPHVPYEKSHYVPNGFDPSDYPSPSRTKRSRFTITYTGTMYGKRNPRTFLKAVAELINERAIDRDKFCLRLVGRFGEEIHHLFTSSEVAALLEVIPYVSHRESLQFLVDSDALLLIVDQYPGNEAIVPGKVFEYIGSLRPIIALAPKGAVSDLIEKTQSGSVVDSDNIARIKTTVLEYYRDFIYDKNRVRPELSEAQKYHRRALTGQLASLFEKALSIQ